MGQVLCGLRLSSPMRRGTIPIVKRALLIPVRYIFSLLFLAMAICIFIIVTDSARYQNLEEGGRNLLFHLVKGLKFGFFFGGIFAVPFVMYYILRMVSRRAIALFLLFLVAVPLFFFGYYGFQQWEKNKFENTILMLSSLDEEHILRFNGGGLYFSEFREGALRSAVVYHYANERDSSLAEDVSNYELVELGPDEQKMSFVDAVRYDTANERLIISARATYTADGSDLVIETSNIENSRRRLFLQSPFLESIMLTIEDILVVLDSSAETLSLPYVLLVLALFFFVFSTWAFIHLTRWPLINFILTLLVIWGGLWLSSIQQIPVVYDFVVTFLSEQAVKYIASASLGVFALLFIIINAFLPSVGDEKRN